MVQVGIPYMAIHLTSLYGAGKYSLYGSTLHFKPHMVHVDFLI